MPARVSRIIMTVLLVVGGLFLLLALGNYNETQKFVAKAVQVHGKVVAMQSHRDSDGDVVYAPTVLFVDNAGNEHTFTALTASNPPDYVVGEHVTVLYDPKDIHTAQIESFIEQYIGMFVFLVLGGVLVVIGLGMLLFKIRKERLRQWLRHNGQIVKATVTSVALNQGYKLNGRSPYVITAQWQDPLSRMVYVFKSDNFWFDPTQYVKDVIAVYIDINNPKKYWIDDAEIQQKITS